MSRRYLAVSVATVVAMGLGAVGAQAETAPLRTHPGQAMTFGIDDQGTLGNGRPFATALSPVSVGRSLSHAVMVSAHAGHMLGLRRDGVVWGWGANDYGQVVPGPSIIARPARITGLPTIAAVDVGGMSSFAVSATGRVYAWGYNGDGELGLGDTTDRATPTLVPGLTGVVRVSAGLNHALALTSDGSVYAWGINDNGQLGTGSRVSSTRPVKVSGLPAARAISAGTTHSLAVGTDGSVWAWGDNEYAQLGDTTFTTRLKPARSALAGKAKDVSAGDFSSFALMRSGLIKAWGTNAAGQLGLGAPGAYIAKPRTVHGIPAAKAVSSGYNHTLAIAKDGTVYGWGAASEGELGLGSALPNQQIPRLIPGISASAVSAGQFVSVVIALR